MINPWENTSLEMLEGEEFRGCLGVEDFYAVSNFGRVKSYEREVACFPVGVKTKKELILKQSIAESNGASVKFCVNGVRWSVCVATLVCEGFLPKKSEGEVYAHKNKIKHDNKVGNLGIMTMHDSRVLDYAVGVRQDWGIMEQGKNTRFGDSETLEQTLSRSSRRGCVAG